MPTYRKPVTITGSSAGAVRAYPIQVTLSYESDMQADFSDVRFRASDAATLLPFYLDSYVASTSAVFWVRVPYIPADPSTATVYAYYGSSDAAGASNGRATFNAWDDFERTDLNESATWTKSASNPIIGASHGDPGAYYEAGTYYLFVDNLTSGNIDLYSGSAYDALTLVGTVLSKGAGAAWDSGHVRDASLVRVGATYHLYYGGQTSSSPSATTHKIGHATASSITGPYTKDAANPVLDLSPSDGANEPSVRYDALNTGREFELLYTFGSGGTADDVITGDIGYAYSSDGSGFTDAGAVISGTLEDQEAVADADGVLHLFVDDGGVDAANLQTALAADVTLWSARTNAGGVLSAGSGAESSGLAAPSVLYDGSFYVLYYQAVGNLGDGVKNRIGVARSPDLHTPEWQTAPGTNGSIASGRLHEAGGSGSWSGYTHLLRHAPPYQVQAEIELALASPGPYMAGVFVAQSATVFYSVIFDPANNKIGIFGTTGGVLSETSDYTIDLDTVYAVRVTVTGTDLTVDFYDGSWHDAILTQSATFIASETGFIRDGASEFYGDNLRVRRYADPEPSPSVGSEEAAAGTTARAYAVILG